MQAARISILSTRPLTPELIAEAADSGIDIEQQSFIETRPIRTVEVQQEIENALRLSTAVVFTSMNAVEAVAEELQQQQPDWRIYCLGNTTRRLVTEYFGADAIAGTAGSAASLASLIAAEIAVEEVLFFCGDKRRDELPDLLRGQGIEVSELVVYETLTTSQRLSRTYDAILFFSPSAVASFFAENKMPAYTLVFAIGDTTAGAVRNYCTNRILTSDEPGKENLVRQTIQFFSQQAK